MTRRKTDAGDLELRLLRTFLTLMECGSLGKTAAIVQITQSAVSQQMLRLERIVGLKLFLRGRNGISLTRQGELFIEDAIRAVALNDEILMRFRTDCTTGPVTLGMTTSIAMAGIAPVLRRFRNIRPKAELRISTANMSKVTDLLVSGKIQLAIAETSTVSKVPAAAWQVHLEWAAPKTLEINPSHSLPLVLFDPPCSWQESLFGSLRQAGRDWHIAFTSNSIDAIVAAADSGFGITALPREIIRKSGLVPVCDRGLPAISGIEFGLYVGRDLSESARTLVELLQSSTSNSRGPLSSCSARNIDHRESQEAHGLKVEKVTVREEIAVDAGKC
ncbi:MAG TPA: LysR family transcriptional regulator [Terriglobales bacterium]|nr:LysR family transcriptional regulator [Terriglobales bacterium]